MFKHTPLFLAVTLSAGLAASVQAQEVQSLRGDNFSIEEVIVTARKKAESLQSVPLAIEALTATTLQEKGITSLADVAKYTPGLSFQVGILPNDTRPTIRGLNSSRGRQNVAVLVDGIDLSTETMTVAGGGTGVNLNLMDLERVEVIKGPQSAMYGRSAFAGAVNYVTKRPGDEFEGKVSSNLDEHGYANIGASVSAPIIEGLLAGSINITKTDFDGIYKNPNTGGDLGGEETEGVAVSFNLTPSDNFSAYFRGEYSESKYTPRPTVLRESTSNIGGPGDIFLLGSIAPGATSAPVFNHYGQPTGTTAADCGPNVSPWLHMVGGPGTTACATKLTGNQGSAHESEIDLSANPRTGKDFEGTEVRNLRTSLELAWDIDDVSVVSLTGFSTNDTRIQEDFDLTDYAVESLAGAFGPGVPTGIAIPVNYNPASPLWPVYPVWRDPQAPWAGAPGVVSSYPGDWTQYGANTNSDTSIENEQFSQEFRFSGGNDKMDWMVSAVYMDESMSSVMDQQWWLRDGVDKAFWDTYVADASFGSMFGVDPMTPDLFGPGTGVLIDHATADNIRSTPVRMSRDTEHVSLAFAVNYNLTDDLRLNLEGRYLEETLDYKSMPIDTLIHNFLGISTYGLVEQTYSRNDEKFVPRIGLDWKANEDTLIYASIAEGYKPGGMTTTDGNGDIQTGEYEPEELTVYELGFKSALLDNRLIFNGSIYHYAYENQQVGYFVSDPQTGVTNTSVTNAGKSEMQGLELSTVYRPSRNWTFTAAYTMSDTEYKEYNISQVSASGSASTYDQVLSGNAEGDFAGKQFKLSAKHSGLLAIRFDGELDSGMGYFSELSGNYESKRYLELDNDAYLPAYWLVDLSAGVSYEHLDVTLYVNNLLDDDKVKNGLGNVSYGALPGGQATALGASLTLATPRTAGVRLSYSF